MARDFRTDQIRTTQIIASGSRSGKPSIIIASASNSPLFSGEPIDDSTLLAGVGAEVFLFVTGSPNHTSLFGGSIVTSGTLTAHGGSVFEGDVTISGTLRAERIVVEVEETTTGSLSVSGSLVVSQSATIFEGLVVNETGEGGAENDFRVESVGEDQAIFLDAGSNTLYINKGPTAFETQIAGVNGEALTVLNAGVIINEANHADNDFRVATVNSTHALFIDSSGGGTSADIMLGRSTAAGADAFFTASGSIGIRGTAHYDAATAVMQGDFLVSGTTTLGAGLEEFAAPPTLPSLIVGTDTVPATATTDVGVFISGSVGQRKTALTYGTTLFGGDVITSGSLTTETGLGVGSTAVDALAPNWPYGLVDIVGAHDPIDDLHSDEDYQAIIRTSDISGGSAGLGFTTITTDNMGAAIIYNDEGSFNRGSLSFYVKDSVADEANPVEKLRLTADGKVFITSGTAPSESAAPDVSFYVSGTGNPALPGSTGIMQGTSLFGGDVSMSGTLNVATIDSLTGSNISLRVEGTERARVMGGGTLGGIAVGRALTHLDDTNTGLYFYDDHVYIDAGGQTAFSAVESTVNKLYLGSYSGDSVTYGSYKFDQVFIMSGSTSETGGMSLNPANFADLGFYVSGAIGRRGTTDKGTSIFGGDVVISGALHGGSALQIGAHEDDLGAEVGFFVSGARSSRDADETVALFGGDTVISGTLYALGSNAGVPAAAFGDTAGSTGLGNDAHVWVSGSIGSQGTSTKGTAVFGGDTVVSGVLFAGGASFHNGVDGGNSQITGGTISGSIHHTSGGLSYLVGGTGMAITSASNGQIRLDASATPGGLDTYVQYNDGGDFAGESTFTFNETDHRLTVNHIAARHALTASQIVPMTGGHVVTFTSSSDDFMVGEDTFIFFSGSINSKDLGAGSTGHHVSTFGGDVVISGTLYGGYYETMGLSALPLRADVNIIQGAAVTPIVGADISLLVSGTAGARDSGVRGVSVIQGDLITSGSKTFINMSPTAAGSESAVTEHVGTNVSFFVSGNFDPAFGGGSNAEALFSGDLRTSGAIRADVGAFIGGSTYQIGALQSYGGATFNVMAGGGSDLTVSGTQKPILHVDASQNTLTIGREESLGIATDVLANDVFMSVSGAMSSKNTDIKGVTVFGGDTVTSGSLFALGSDSGLTTAFFGGLGAASLGNDWNFYVSGAMGSAGSLATRGAAVFTGDLAVSGGINAGTLNDPLEAFRINYNSDRITMFAGLATQSRLLVNNSKGSAIDVTTSAVTINGAVGDTDFYVGSDNKAYAFMVDASTDQVGILTSGPGDPGGLRGKDVNFFVSGAIDSKDGEIYGSTLFGGDLVVSGVIHGGVDEDMGVPYLEFNADTTVVSSKAGSQDVDTGADTIFFVSGTIDSQGSTTRGTAAFGGDVVVSGSIIPGLDLTSDLGSASNRFANVYTGDLHLKNERGNWTIVEEVDYLCVVNNITGKKYKMMLEPIDNE